MFASATSGDRHNNNKFSHCSKSNISAVLDAITDGRKPNCFTESNGAFCGNKIVEEGEECDCGFDDHECDEQCCYPRKSDDLSEEENKRNRCVNFPGKVTQTCVGGLRLNLNPLYHRADAGVRLRLLLGKESTTVGGSLIIVRSVAHYFRPTVEPFLTVELLDGNQKG